jgi:hypothetical protein
MFVRSLARLRTKRWRSCFSASALASAAKDHQLKVKHSLLEEEFFSNKKVIFFFIYIYF